jgi:hypothetical protein
MSICVEIPVRAPMDALWGAHIDDGTLRVVGSPRRREPAAFAFLDEHMR